MMGGSLGRPAAMDLGTGIQKRLGGGGDMSSSAAAVDLRTRIQKRPGGGGDMSSSAAAMD